MLEGAGEDSPESGVVAEWCPWAMVLMGQKASVSTSKHNLCHPIIQRSAHYKRHACCCSFTITMFACFSLEKNFTSTRLSFSSLYETGLRRETITGTDLLRQQCVLPHQEVANQTTSFTQSQDNATGPTSLRKDHVTPGSGIMEADDRQVTTVFTV